MAGQFGAAGSLEIAKIGKGFWTTALILTLRSINILSVLAELLKPALLTAMPMRRSHKDLGSVIIQRWGKVPKPVPDFGQKRPAVGSVAWLRLWTTECAPLAAGLALIWILESIDLTSGQNEPGRFVQDRQLVAVQKPAEPAAPGLIAGTTFAR